MRIKAAIFGGFLLAGCSGKSVPVTPKIDYQALFEEKSSDYRELEMNYRQLWDKYQSLKDIFESAWSAQRSFNPEGK